MCANDLPATAFQPISSVTIEEDYERIIEFYVFFNKFIQIFYGFDAMAFCVPVVSSFARAHHTHTRRASLGHQIIYCTPHSLIK